MTPDDFRRAISNGIGRVPLFLQSHDATPYRDIICDACIHGGGYDRQIEGSHSDYLFKIVNLTNDKKYYRDAVLGALADETEQGWDMVHLMDMAKFFAMEGDEGARQAMYAKFTTEIENDYWVGGSSIIEMDGMDGFLFVADKLGQLALDDEEFEDDDYYWVCLKFREPEVPEDELRAALNQARAENPRVDAYLSSIDGYREEREERSKKRKRRKNPMKYTYEEVRAVIQEFSSTEDSRFERLWLRKWGENASQDQLVQAAEDLLNETNEGRLIAYLQIFESIPFPLDCGKLIDLAQHAEHVPAYAAMRALANTVDPRIRDIALTMIRENNRIEIAVEMLSSNFETSDWALIEQLLTSPLDRDSFHSLCMAVRAVFERNPSLDGVGALLYIYENTPCGVCRSSVVQMIHALGALPDHIAEECKFDAYDCIREWARDGYEIRERYSFE